MNECVRIKGGEECYKKWLFPNPDGTFGCARWIKEVEVAEIAPAESVPAEVEGVVLDKESSDQADNQVEVSVDGSEGGVDSTICQGKKEVEVEVANTEDEGETSSETTSTNSSVESSESDEKEEHSASDAAKEDKHRRSAQMPELLAMTDSDTDHSQ